MGLSSVSAPGSRMKENSLSPLSLSATKARLVAAAGSMTRPSVLIPARSAAAFRKRPCISSPTLPIKAVESPCFAAAARRLAGAPPGFCSKSG